MFAPRTNFQASQMQNIINRTQIPGTAAHYALKQIEPQIVKISSSTSRVQISLPGLQTNFKEISDAQGSQLDQVYYAVKCLRIRNNFTHIKRSDRIAISFKDIYIKYFFDPIANQQVDYNDIPVWQIKWRGNQRWSQSKLQINPVPQWPDVYYDVFHLLQPFFIPLSRDYNPNDYSLEYDNHTTIIDTLNFNLQRLLGEIAVRLVPGNVLFYQNAGVEQSIVGNQLTSATSFLAQYTFLNIMSKLQFGFNEDTQTIEMIATQEKYLRMSYTHSIYELGVIQDIDNAQGYRMSHVNFALPDQDNSFFDEGTIIMCVDPFSSLEDQERVGYLLGFDGEYNINQIYQDLINSWFEPNYAKLLLSTHKKQCCAFELTPYISRTLLSRGLLRFQHLFEDISIQQNYSQPLKKINVDQVKTFNFDRINVHSSLKSNWLDIYGRKSDIIAQFDLQLSNNFEIQEYRSHYDLGRDFSAKDNLQSLKNFYVELRSQNGEVIPVEEVGGYELEIVLWFMPADPSLYNL